MVNMTAEQFQRYYSTQTGLGKYQLQRLGWYAKPCKCGQPHCKGWRGEFKKEMVAEALVGREDPVGVRESAASRASYPSYDAHLRVMGREPVDEEPEGPHTSDAFADSIKRAFDEATRTLGSEGIPSRPRAIPSSLTRVDEPEWSREEAVERQEARERRWRDS